MNKNMKSEMKETFIMAFVFGMGFWMAAEIWSFIYTFISEILDLM